MCDGVYSFPLLVLFTSYHLHLHLRTEQDHYQAITNVQIRARAHVCVSFHFLSSNISKNYLAKNSRCDLDLVSILIDVILHLLFLAFLLSSAFTSVFFFAVANAFKVFSINAFSASFSLRISSSTCWNVVDPRGKKDFDTDAWTIVLLFSWSYRSDRCSSFSEIVGKLLLRSLIVFMFISYKVPRMFYVLIRYKLLPHSLIKSISNVRCSKFLACSDNLSCL